jgi:hypothetical protein
MEGRAMRVDFFVKSFLYLSIAIAIHNPPQLVASDILGDINNNGRVGLEESIYGLQVAAGLSPSTILDPISGPQRTAWGTYTYLSNVLTLSTTFSTFESSGIDLGITEIPVDTVTATTLTLIGHPMTLTRQAGEAGNIVGKWQGIDSENNDTTIILDDSGSFLISIKGDEFTKVIDIPKNTSRTIDGDFSDWSSGSSVDLFGSESDCGDIDGRKITSVSVAQDSNFIYVKMSLNGPYDTTFRYKLGNLIHIRVVPPPALGVPASCGISSPFGGQNSGSAAFGTGDSDNPPDNRHLLECRIPKCVGLDHWHHSGFRVWADQDSVSTCRSNLRPEIRSKFSSNNTKARKRSSVVHEKMGVIGP